MIGHDYGRHAHAGCGYVYSNNHGTVILYAADKKIGRSQSMREAVFLSLLKEAFKAHTSLLSNVRWPHPYVEIGTGNVLIPHWEILDGLELHS